VCNHGYIILTPRPVQGKRGVLALLGAGPQAATSERPTVGLAGACGLAAFLFDVYLYWPVSHLY